MSKQIKIDINISTPSVSKEQVARHIASLFTMLAKTDKDDMQERFGVQLCILGAFSALLALGYIDQKGYDKLTNAVKKHEGEVIPS